MAQIDETRMTLRVPAALYKKLRLRAAAREESLNQHIVDLIELDVADIDMTKSKDRMTVLIEGGLDNWLSGTLQVFMRGMMKFPLDKYSNRMKKLLKKELVEEVSISGGLTEWKADLLSVPIIAPEDMGEKWDSRMEDLLKGLGAEDEVREADEIAKIDNELSKK